MYAIPSIINVLLVCLVFWLIFSIMGVQVVIIIIIAGVVVIYVISTWSQINIIIFSFLVANSTNVWTRKA